MSEIKAITQKILGVIEEREWGQFHNPKDLAISLSLEAGEVLEHFQWKNGDEIDQYVVSHREEISDELADVGIYLLELANFMKIDILEAMENKIQKNIAKYPIEKSKGNHKKYTDF